MGPTAVTTTSTAIGAVAAGRMNPRNSGFVRPGRPNAAKPNAVDNTTAPTAAGSVSWSDAKRLSNEAPSASVVQPERAHRRHARSEEPCSARAPVSPASGFEQAPRCQRAQERREDVGADLLCVLHHQGAHRSKPRCRHGSPPPRYPAGDPKNGRHQCYAGERRGQAHHRLGVRDPPDQRVQGEVVRGRRDLRLGYPFEHLPEWSRCPRPAEALVDPQTGRPKPVEEVDRRHQKRRREQPGPTSRQLRRPPSLPARA